MSRLRIEHWFFQTARKKTRAPASSCQASCDLIGEVISPSVDHLGGVPNLIGLVAVADDFTTAFAIVDRIVITAVVVV